MSKRAFVVAIVLLALLANGATCGKSDKAPAA